MYYRIIYKLIGPPDLTQVNKRIIRFIDQDGFDLVWLDKGLMIKPETLRKVKDSSPRTIIVGYSPDDMGSKHIQSKKFLGGLPYYDLYCTTKTYNVQELKDLGCPRVMFIGNAYDPKTHRQMAVSPEERREFGGPVGFIGAYEDERAESIFFLAQRGIPVRVWGQTGRKNANLSIRT